MPASTPPAPPPPDPSVPPAAPPAPPPATTKYLTLVTPAGTVHELLPDVNLMTQSLPTWLIDAVKTSPTAAEHPPLVIVPAAAFALETPMTDEAEATNTSDKMDASNRGMVGFSLAF